MGRDYTPTNQRVAFDETKYSRNRWLLNMFNKYEDYYRNEIERLLRNQRMYWGVNLGQWPAYVVERLKAEGRLPHQYNILAKKIDSGIGSYIANGFDMKYMTVDGKKTDWSMHLQDMAYSDKSNCDWETSEIVALRDSKIMVGYERMLVSEKYDSDFGNIAFEPLPPSHIYLDIGWKSPYADDIENYFEWGMYSVDKIIDMYPKAIDSLKEWKQREEWSGVDFGDYHGGVQRYRNTEEKWGGFHRVITFHSVKKVERKWEYDLVNRCVFPETGFEPDTPEDKEAKQKYMQEAGVEEGQYMMVTQKKRIKRVETICPSLNNEMFLAAGKDRIQTNNCNIYPIGNSFYGQFKGDVDDLSDLQIDFNKNRMNMLDMQARTAKGAHILDEALAGGDAKKKREIEMAWNDPAAKIWVEEGSTNELGVNGGVIELRSHPPTPDMFNMSAGTLDLADWLSSMPAAMDARSEGAQESGKLYQSKVQVGLVGQKFGMSIYARHKRSKAMAYILQAKITYSGFPRHFAKTGSKDSVGINLPSVDPMGRRVLINNISTMPEMKVLLIQSTSGIAIRTEMRSQYSEVLQLLTDPADRLLKLIFVGKIFNTQDMPDEDKEEITRAVQMLTMMEAMKISAEMTTMQAQLQQMGIQQPNEVPGTGATPDNFDQEQAMRGTPQEQQLIEQGAVS